MFDGMCDKLVCIDQDKGAIYYNFLVLTHCIAFVKFVVYIDIFIKISICLYFVIIISVIQ